MKIITLGTGHGSATATHMSSITCLECGGKTYLIDCADGTDAVMMQKHLNPSDLTAVFITHMHLDHTGGLPVIMKRNVKEEAARMTIVLPDMELIPCMEQWIALQGFAEQLKKEPFIYRDSKEGYDDGNLKLTAQATEHLASTGKPSYAYRIETENKILCFTGDLRGDCQDFPFAAANNTDLVVSELTHFRLEHIWPYLEKLQTQALIFNHLGNWSQVPEEQERIKEKCKALPYPVTLAYDGMEITL
ncbi:MAG: ribonuclease Z [Lentisphaerae bacterium]|nr:ribonuclease Z [Lentisphaerota bacterium]